MRLFKCVLAACKYSRRLAESLETVNENAGIYRPVVRVEEVSTWKFVVLNNVNGDNTIYLETGKGNEIYNGDDGALDLRQLDQ